MYSYSKVVGATFEIRGNYNRILQLEGGLTIQKSRQGKPVFWSEQLPGTKKFLRTPETYGFFTFTWTPGDRFTSVLSGIYTGSMLVPHYGLAGDPGTPEQDLLFESPDFIDLNLKLSYIFELKRLDSSLELFGGINNLLNHYQYQYQYDFDSGKNRDSGYIYGPAKPRHFFTGLKISDNS